jgi:hypothetical protein
VRENKEQYDESDEGDGMRPADSLGKWMKDHPHANQAHRILRYDKQILVGYCGKNFPAEGATLAVSGVLLCQECVRLWQVQLVAKREAIRPNKAALRLVTRAPSGQKR